MLAACTGAAEVATQDPAATTSVAPAPSTSATVATTIAAATTSTSSTTTTTIAPDPSAGWIAEEVDEGVGGGIRDFATGPLGTFILTGAHPEDSSQIVSRDDGGVWKVALGLPEPLGQGPQAHMAVGESRAIALLGRERRAISAAYSDDGVTWESARSTGFPAGTQLTDVVSASNGFVAIGEVDGYSATWISGDGIGWTETKRWNTRRPRLMGLAAGPTSVVIVGRLKQQNYAWSSPDGRTWVRRSLESPVDLFPVDVVWADGQYVAVGRPRNQWDRELNPVVMTSADGGTWVTSEVEPRLDMSLESRAAGGAELVTLGRTFYPQGHPNNCVLQGCGEPENKLFSFDGGVWSERRVPFVNRFGDAGRVVEVAGTLMLAVTQPGGIEMWRDGPAVEVARVAQPETPEIPWEWIDQGENPQLEVGVEYAIRFGGHCGITWTNRPLDDRYWWVVDDWEFPPEIDDLGGSYFGTLELVEEDSLVFRVLGEIVAKYAPKEGPFGCE